MDPEAVNGAPAHAGVAAPVDTAAPSAEQLLQRDIDRQKVDVSRVCGDAAGRSHAYGVLRQLQRWGLLREIGPFVRVEKGAALRGAFGSSAVSAHCAGAVNAAVLVFEGLTDLVRSVVDGGAQFARPAAKPTEHEELLLALLQRWLDQLAESMRYVNTHVLEVIAGFGGCDVSRLARFSSSTGVEAGWRLSWSVRHAIARAIDHPFMWLGLVLGEQRRSLPVSGRDAPQLPSELEDDDRAILLAVAAGLTKPKDIYRQLRASGSKLTALLIRQRKRDLVGWELILPRRGHWKLTSKGEEWVRELRLLGHRGDGDMPGTTDGSGRAERERGR